MSPAPWYLQPVFSFVGFSLRDELCVQAPCVCWAGCFGCAATCVLSQWCLCREPAGGCVQRLCICYCVGHLPRVSHVCVVEEQQQCCVPHCATTNTSSLHHHHHHHHPTSCGTASAACQCTLLHCLTLHTHMTANTRVTFTSVLWHSSEHLEAAAGEAIKCSSGN